MENPLDRPVTSFATKQFALIDGETDVARAVEAMQASKCDTVIVTSRGVPVGIVTDSDILDKVVQTGGDSDAILLKTVMTSPIITVSPKATVREVLGLMRFYKIKRVPIVERDGVIGIVVQDRLANSIRTSVLERVFRKYRAEVHHQLKPLLGNMGIVIQFAGILLVFPAFLGIFLGQTQSAVGVFIAVVGLFATGLVLHTYGERGPLSMKQSSILVVTSIVVIGLFGSIPYMYVNPFGNVRSDALFVNSFFESISGYTTTGQTMIPFPEKMPETLNFYRSYTQWVGGLSFIYLIMMLFYPEKKLSGMNSLLGGTMLGFKQMLITISIIFTAYTAILILLLYLTGAANIIYDTALIFSTVTSGGFSPSSTLLSLDNAPRLFIVGAGMIISALPFAFHYSIFRKQLRVTRLGMEVLIYAVFLITAIPIFIALSGIDPLTGAFHLVSASTTTGMQFLNITPIPVAAKVMLIIMMMAGGTAFSTAGGIKIGRFYLVYQRITKKKLSDIAGSVSTGALDKIFREAVLVITTFVAVGIATGFAIGMIENVPFDNALFEATSALSTSGLQTGIIAVDSDIVSKFILMADMVAGRFEIIAILSIFVSRLRR